MGANNEKFRIVEENGKFDIQKYYPSYKLKIIFWEFNVGGFWYDLNKDGHYYYRAQGSYDTRMESFNTLDEAKVKIESLKRGKVIHKIA